RSVPSITTALQVSLPCRRDTHDDKRLPSVQYERISGCSALSVLLPECYIGILPEMFDILFDQRGQLPRLANLDPVIHRSEEAVTQGLKCAAGGVDKLEDQHRRVMDLLPQLSPTPCIFFARGVRSDT